MTIIPMFLGGLTLFIYGMDQMSQGLKLLTGKKLQEILEKLTSNRILGVLVGLFLTVIIQSSSIASIMLVGLVNSKLMTLSQAFNVIMGANIGTTLKSLLFTLELSLLAPLFAFVGMIMILFNKKRNCKYIGSILFGFGLLFIGLYIMGESLKPLAAKEFFVDILAKASKPIVGILVGTIFTALVQSSSVTTGILITFALNDVMTFESAFYLILGSNIGTCVTAVLASLGTSKDAKRVALSHVLYNIIGSLLFAIVARFSPLISFFEKFSPDIAMQIAYLHIVLNIFTTIVILPFSNYLEDLTRKIIPGEDAKDKGLTLMYIKSNSFSEALPSILSIKQELMRMYDYARENTNLAIKDLLDNDEDLSAEIDYNEEIIDFLNTEISKVSINTLTDNMSGEQYKRLSYYIKISSNIERLGDYAYNILKLTNRIYIEKFNLSSIEKEEIRDVARKLEQVFEKVKEGFKNESFDLKTIHSQGNEIQKMIESHRNNSISRIRNGETSAEAGIAYDKVYSYILRIKDHLINISEQYSIFIN